MMNSKIQVSADDIVECIEMEHCDKIHTQARDTEIMAKSTNESKPKPKCSVCGRSGHTNDKCWEAGGGCEGKAPDWWKKKWSLACTSKDEESLESAALTHATTTHHEKKREKKRGSGCQWCGTTTQHEV